MSEQNNPASDLIERLRNTRVLSQRLQIALQNEAADALAAKDAEIARLRGLMPVQKPQGSECPASHDGYHHVDTTMESGPYNCFHCERPMR